MDELIIRVLREEASPFEVERLNRWRRESSENDAYYRETAQVWALTAPEPRDIGSSPPGVEEILGTSAVERFGAPEGEGPVLYRPPARESETDPPAHKRPVRSRLLAPPRMAWGILAASVAALAFGIRGVGWMGPQTLAEYSAPEHQTLNVTLDDGSLVRLAGGSRLRVWDREETREVSLEGRAFFAVTRNESMPFVVHTDPGDVRVLGTRFEVAEEEAGIRTVVLEGRVALSNAEGSVDVPAGSMARMWEGEVPEAETVENPWSLLDWPDGILVFQETPLSQVAEEVSRHFGQTLLLSDSEIGTRRITAWFQGETFSEVTEAICMVLYAACTRDGSIVTVGPRTEAGVNR